MKTTTCFSDYRKLEQLGKGGNAEVSRAAKGETVVALKILRTTPPSKEKEQRFIDETHSVLRVQNEIRGILPILDYALPDAERRQKRQADVNHTNAILAAAKLRSAFEDWVEKNLSVFDFNTLCKQQTNSGTN